MAVPDTLGLPGRAVLTATAAVTVLLAVFFDVAAGEPPVHVATLGAIVAAVAGLRVLLGGRHRHLLQFCASGVAVQPALHALVKLIPHGELQHGHGSRVGHADVAVIGTQVALVVIVVAAICLAERLVLAITGVICACWIRLLLHPVRPAPAVVLRRAAPAPECSSRLVYRDAVVERGPPSAIWWATLPV